MDLAITTLVTVPAILGLVTIARDLGVPAKFAPALAVLFGVGVAVAEQQLGHLPAFQAGVGGLLVGLAASGVYDASKLAGGRLAPSPDSASSLDPVPASDETPPDPYAGHVTAPRIP